MYKTNRVVITGMGAISSLGDNVSEIWESIMNYKLGYSHKQHKDTTVNAKFFGLIERELDLNFFPKRILKYLPRFAKLGVIAANEAIEMAFPGNNLDYYSPFEVGTIFGTGWGGIDACIDNNDLYKNTGIASPFSCIFSMHSVCTAAISMNWNIRGYQNTSIGACATSNMSIGDAYELIKTGKAKCMVVGGADSITEDFNVWSVDILGALSKEQHKAEDACCPFSKNRSGFILSEGAAVLVLEDYESAKKRNANILAELVSCSNYSDAFDITIPAKDMLGRIHSVRTALDDAKLKVVDYINAHGTSTYLNDLNETNAIKNIFGEEAYNIPISSTKSYTGHLMGGSGAIESIFCIKTLNTKIIPATTNLNEPDNECDLDYVPNKHRHEPNIKTALNINYGFGGTNSALIFKAL